MRALYALIAACSAILCRGYSSEITTCLLHTGQMYEHQLEIFIQKPHGENTPLLVLLHGASTDRGIKTFSQECIDSCMNRGYAVAGISLPGFGQSTGRKDFCGPFTMKWLHFALDAIKEECQAKDFGVIGFGQGGLAALLLASERPDIRCIVCPNAVVDLLAHLNPESRIWRGLFYKNYDIVLDEENFLLRSPMQRVQDILSPAFLLIREESTAVPPSEVKRFAEAMRHAGKTCQVSVLPKAPEGRDPDIIFCEEVFGETAHWIDAHMH